MSDFPQATLEQWQARVAAVLKGDGNLEKLVSQTADGIRIQPLYQQMQEPRADRAFHGPWNVLQRVDHPDGNRANLQALEDLENGANGLSIVLNSGDCARGFGLATADQIESALQDVALHAIHTRLEGGAALASAFARHVEKQPIDPARLDVTFGLRDAAPLKNLLAQGFTGPFLEADGRALHDAGATEAQELACVLSLIVGYLRKLDHLPPEALGQAVSAALSANQDMFLGMAKFRAMRLLWTRVLEASGLPHHPLHLHGETSWRMMARLDPHSNILRATAAVFAAGLGGADSFTVLPFSLAQGLPNGFARRMARNTQAILLEESQLWRVADAASGAGYVESLTHELCSHAWTLFQAIEKSGKLPEFNAVNTSSDAVIGTRSYQLANEFEAAVETVA